MLDLVLDFNYAYHPSCHYNPRWVCPLAPSQNRLDFPIPVGEMTWQTCVIFCFGLKEEGLT
jgi:uncharacterized protein (DUF1684 family)